MKSIPSATAPVPSPDAPPAVTAPDAGPPLLGPALLGLSVGCQLLVAALVCWGPKARSGELLASLTRRGEFLARPEADMRIYLLALVVTLALTIGMIRAWRGWVRRIPQPSEQHRFARVTSVWFGVLAAISLLLLFHQLASRFDVIRDVPEVSFPMRKARGPIDLPLLLLPAVAALVCAVWDARRGSLAPGAVKPRAAGDGAPTTAGRAGRWVTELFAPVVILLAVLVPRGAWSSIAGHYTVQEELHHWNYFVMGPALQYMHGRALCAETYTQYGVGWPLVFAGFHQQPTYAGMIGTASVYGVAYFIGLYLLARALFRRVLWAALAATLAILLQLYNGVEPGNVIWGFPSSTFMRHPLDVWFFLVLLAASRQTDALKRDARLAAAGALAGAGVAFCADTGIALVGTLAVYLFAQWIGRRGRPAGPGGRFPVARAAGISAAAMLATLVFLAAWANQWHFPGARFLGGWIEGLRIYLGIGFGFLPIAGIDEAGMAMFVGVVVIYLLQVLRSALDLRRTASSPETLVLTCLAIYGLAIMNLFIGRSLPQNLYHCIVPFAVVLCGLLIAAQRATASHLLSDSVFPPVMMAVVLILLFSKAEFLETPTAAAAIFKPVTQGGIELVPGDLRVPDIPEPEFQLALEVNGQLVQALRELAAQGQRVAFISHRDTVMYYQSGMAPWFPYPTIFDMMFSRAKLDQTVRQLHIDRPPYVLIQDKRRDLQGIPYSYADVWEAFYDSLPEHYERVKGIGGYGLWKRKP